MAETIRITNGTDQEPDWLAEERRRKAEWAEKQVVVPAGPVAGPKGWTVADLRAAFNEIAPTNDWKGPIDACVLATRFDLMAHAVEFMTATKLEAIQHIGNGWLRVNALGYRMGPAGDH